MTMREVQRTVRGEATSDGAGVRLVRVIGGGALPDLDPFLLFDEFGSEAASDYIAGFPDHPHRGFETVTYMLAGRMRHRDNQGNSGLLTAGSVQWMTAGRGIVHSEMPEQERGLMRGFQLWVNLPAKDKMCAPRYQDIDPARVPEVVVPAAAGSAAAAGAAPPAGRSIVRVLAGRFGEVEGPVNAVATEPLYLDVALDAGARFDAAVPAGHQAFAYVYEGGALLGARRVPVARGELAVLSSGDRFEATAVEACRLVLVAGRPLREPVVRYGPFVMNTRDEIVQAIEDFNAGRF